MKRIFFLLIICLLGGASAEAQYTYSIKVKQNTGADIAGTNNTYLTASGSGTRTRTKTRRNGTRPWTYTDWSVWSEFTGTPALTFSNHKTNMLIEGAITENPTTGNSRTETQQGEYIGSEWTFEAVDYKTENGKIYGQPGWYYIRNTGTGMSDYYLEIENGSPSLTDDPSSDGAMWRLIKVPVEVDDVSRAVLDVDNMFFKLVSKSGASLTLGEGGGTLLYHDGGNTTTTVSASAVYDTDRSVFLLTQTEESIVKNDDQEIVSNESHVNALNAWLNLPPEPEITEEWNDTGGDITAVLESYPYTFAPIGYAGAINAKLMYGHYAAGNTEGDGFFFTRLPKAENLIQNLNSFKTDENTVIVFTVWLRAITSTDKSELDVVSNVNGTDMYGVGKVTLTFDEAYEGKDTMQLTLSIPDWAITPLDVPNDPDAWYLYSRVITSDSHKTRSIKSVELVNTLSTTDEAQLDVDNMLITLRSITPQAIFRYKDSGSTQQSRQSVHEQHQTIYTNLGQTENLTTSTQNFAYYRWYKMTSSQEIYPDGLNATLTSGSTEATLANGILYFNSDKSAISRGYQANYEIDGDNFFYSDDATIYCDISHYSDFTWSGDVANNSGQMDEPSLSLRNVFHLRPASEIADSINSRIDKKGQPYEFYNVEAPTGIRLRLTPQYLVSNYWIKNTSTSTPVKATRFLWRRFTPTQLRADSTLLYEKGKGTNIPTGSTGTYSFVSGSDNAYKYLQVNNGESAGDTIYFAVDLATGSGYSYTAQKRLAIFQVVYKDKGKVGPKLMSEADVADLGKDIFASIPDKKLIISKTFDQMDKAPETLPNAFPPRNIIGNYSVYGMGVQRLSVDESNYGFVNPLHYSNNGTNTGTHLHHRAPFWSEYGFPQQINGEATDSYGWSNGGDEVSDITYLRAGGGTAPKGNMLYVDAAEQPGVVAALNFNESFCAGARLYFSAWMVNLNSSSNTSADNSTSYTRPNLVFVLKTIADDGTETVIKRFYTGDIGYNNVNEWYQIGFDFVIPDNLSRESMDFRLEIQNNGLNTNGNDFAIDEICVYRTNPAISAVRTNDIFCMPEGAGIEVTDSLEMSIEVNLSQLWPVASDHLDKTLHFRFIDAKFKTFPGQQQGDTGADMYVNMAYYEDENESDPIKRAKYHYGRIEIDKFINGTEGEGEYFSSDYEGMSIVVESSGDRILKFKQLIPAYVLNDGDANNDFNTGIYSIFVGENAPELLKPECAGEASFRIKFDATDFEMTVGGIGMGETGELAICTNNDVDVKAYATAPNTDEQMFAYYDWYLGPLNTQPNIVVNADTTYNAREFTYTLEGQYPGPIGTDTVLFRTIENAPIRNRDGFNVWLDTIQGQKWLLDENYNGPSWAWGEPNYVGFNQHGGYFRHIPVEEVDRAIELDAVTSATRIGAADNKNTAVNEGKPVSFRTLKQDLAAYRFFYPYEPNLPETEVDVYPVDPTKTGIDGKKVQSIDYRTGEYYLEENLTSEIDSVYATSNNLRFTDESYANKDINHNIQYLTNYRGEFVDVDGEVLIDQNDVDNRVPYIRNMTDFKELLARMRYWTHRGFMILYKDRIGESITSLAANYLTVIPTDVAFLVDDINKAELSNDDLKNTVHICTTPSQISLRAENWSPDSWFGQVGPLGMPDMPYFDIDSEEYIYTVRMPERTTVIEDDEEKEIRPTTQFVLPMLYFDEIRTLRVKLVDVYDAEGNEMMLERAIDKVVEQSYIGLIDTVYTNRLDTAFYVPIDRKYNMVNDLEEDDFEELDLATDPTEMNVRWKLTSNRGPFCAFESYPLVHNGYNYFFEDPDQDNEVSQEGDPLPIGTRITAGGRTKEVNNNRIGIEVMANDEVLERYTMEMDGERHFIPGYIYDFVLEAAGGIDWSGGGECDLSIDFRLKVVPDTVIWGGTLPTGDFSTSEWNIDNNWYMPLRDETTGAYTDKPSDMLTFPPLPDTHVVIPSPSDTTTYATLEEYEYLISEYVADQEGHVEETGYDNTKKVIAFELVRSTFEPPTYRQKDTTAIRTTPFIEFDYNYVPNACKVIHFKEGAELARQEQLHYQEAKVDLPLATNRWYGLSAPLRQLYSGDFIFARQNPLVEMRLFNTASPQTGALSADWTQPFSNANEELQAGVGFSARVGKVLYKPDAFYDDPDEGIKYYGSITELTDTAYYLPGSAMSFDFYNEITKALTFKDYQKIENGGRDFSNRFVYEVTRNGESVPLSDTLLVRIPTLATDTAIAVGNPFMAHIYFVKFYEVNKDLIEPQYKILSGGNQYESLVIPKNSDGTLDYSNIVATGDLTLTSIPPMQSFIVTLKASESAGELKITPDMSVIDKSSSLRSTTSSSSPQLTITASTVDHSSKALVVLSEKADKEYNSAEDSRVMLINGVKEVPKVFTVTDDMYLDINQMWGLPKELPIGLVTDSKLKTTITLSGFLALNDYEAFYFKDVKENVLTRITGDSFTYTFDNTEGDQLGRFSLVSSLSPTALEEITDSSIRISLSRGVIYVYAVDGSEITNVSVVRANGETIYRQMQTGKSQLEIPVSGYTQEVLMVKAATNKGNASAKVLNH